MRKEQLEDLLLSSAEARDRTHVELIPDCEEKLQQAGTHTGGRRTTAGVEDDDCRRLFDLAKHILGTAPIDHILEQTMGASCQRLLDGAILQLGAPDQPLLELAGRDQARP